MPALKDRASYAEIVAPAGFGLTPRDMRHAVSAKLLTGGPGTVLQDMLLGLFSTPA